MSERFQLMTDWLKSHSSMDGELFSSPEVASNDASFRRYFRSFHPQLDQSFVIMDAPPEHEDCRPFVDIANRMAAMQVNVPKIYAEDFSLGFLLLSDFGNNTFFSVLNEDNAESLYQSALASLVKIQQHGDRATSGLPAFDASLLQTEMDLFTDWLMAEHLELGFNATQQTQWQKACQYLIDSALGQPQTFVHRDYHSRNLMLTDNGPGILDFQDAVKGPLSYDAVSLLRDCYMSWPAEQIRDWQRMYFLMLVEQNIVDKSEWQGFVKSMDLMGVQRHLKASGIFARLLHRDGKEGYMPDVPNTLNYLVEVAKDYSELHFLVDFIETKMLEKLV